MVGFFKEGGELAPPESVPVARKRTTTKKVITDPCEACGLYKGCTSPKMDYTGDGDKKILIIAEAPGEKEDRTGIQLVGDAGQELRTALNVFGLDLDTDFWKTNACMCRPPKNRKPTRKELKCCSVRVKKTIQTLKPKFIWLMGTSAVTSFYMDRFSDLGINIWRKRLIPDYRYNCFVIPLFHPSYLLRNLWDEGLKMTFYDDLAWALSAQNKKLPPNYNSVLDDSVLFLETERQVLGFLRKILMNDTPVFIDYETSSVNSHKPDPRIWTVGINGVSFGLDHPKTKYNTQSIEKLLSQILTNKNIPKVANNVKFEDVWSRSRFGVVPQGWIHDTMVSQHILEHRPTSTALKFQSFVKWGVDDYEAEMKKYLPTEEGMPNTLFMMPLGDLALYNAKDTVLTKKLYDHQQRELEKYDDLERANNLFLEGTLAFCDIEPRGICVNGDWYDERTKAITNDIEALKTKMIGGQEGRLFKKRTGRELKLNSNKDLIELFYTFLKFKSEKTTATGNPSVDVEALSMIKSPFVDMLLKYRKLIKIRDTYLSQFVRENIRGKIHPQFLLHVVDSYRSSCVRPNFQNIPVRDEDAKRETRSGIIPSKGNKLMEIDYSSMEVRICACYSRDPRLIEYINDPTTDMHRDEAMELFLLPENEVSESIRFHAKNGFVFAEIYGSYYKTTGTNLWEVSKDLKLVSGKDLRAHLRSHNIRTIDDFIEHVRGVEDSLWSKFPLIKEWKDESEQFYYKRGYIPFLFGHRRSGYLTRNMIANYPIQGAAFHCLLWSLIQINKIRKEEKWKTRILGQIHDSIIFDLYPPEQEYVIQVAQYIMTQKIREEFPFLIVPLEAKPEITEVDGSWYTKKKIK